MSKSRQRAIERFAALVERPDPPLAESALAIAAAGDPPVDAEVWLAELDQIADGVQSLEGLLRRLFVEHRFRGDTADYSNPRNSYLHRVLDRRRGIPISLSVVTIEVARRAGLDLQPVGMPGHFLVGVPAGVAGTVPRWIDAFGGGRLLDAAGAEDLFRAATGAGPEVAFSPHWLTPVPAHDVLSRMLANLLAIFRVRGEGAEIEWVVRLRLALPHVPISEAAELGRALAAQGRHFEGARELESIAEANPEAAAGLLLTARSIRAEMN